MFSLLPQVMICQEISSATILDKHQTLYCLHNQHELKLSYTFNCASTKSTGYMQQIEDLSKYKVI